MTQLQADAEKLFAQYLTHWNAQDFEKIAACYTEPCVFVVPAATLCLPDRKAFVEFLENLFGGLNADGFSHSAAGQCTAVDCGNGTAVLDVENIQRLRGDGTALETIDAHYILKNTEDGWKFSVAVICEPGWRP